MGKSKKNGKKTILIIAGAVVAVAVIAIGLLAVRPGGTTGGTAGGSQGSAPAATAGSTGKAADSTVTYTSDDGSVSITMGTATAAVAEEGDEGTWYAGGSESGGMSAEEAVQTGTALRYEEFYALSPEAKDAYLGSFGGLDAFFDWLVSAQERFKAEHPDAEISADGTIDLSKL